MKKVVLILVVAVLLPKLALAAWWNPFSWKIFNKNDAKTQALESKIAELQEKLDQKVATSSISTVPKTEKQKTVKVVAPVIQTPQVAPAPVIQKLAPTISDLTDQYSDLRAVITEERGRTKAISDNEAEVSYNSFLSQSLARVDADLGYLNSIKSWSKKPDGIESIYQQKLASLKSDYQTHHDSYAANYSASQLQTAQRKVIDYIEANKQSLYVPDIHVTAAAFLDVYDKLSGTHYGEKFKLTKTKQETVEFANSFLIDLGEPLNN